MGKTNSERDWHEVMEERVQLQVRRSDMPAGEPGTGSSAARTRGHFKQVTAAQRLAELGFDPLKEMVGVFRECEHQILNISGIDNHGNVIRAPEKARSAPMVVAGLIQTKQKICVDLMRYQYARVPEGQDNQEERDITPPTIKLTGIGEDTQARIAVKHKITRQEDIDGEDIDMVARAQDACGDD